MALSTPHFPLVREGRVPSYYDAIALFSVVLAIYLRTAFPDVTGGDSGELVAAVVTGGTIHPPGYPLYQLLGGLFLAIPMGTAAFRLNVMSAVASALAAAVLVQVARRGGASRGGAIVAGAALASAPLVWQYAISAEVFALNQLLVALALLAVTCFDARPSLRTATLGALVFGLGMANHQTFLCTGVPLGVFVLARGRATLLTPRGIGALTAAFAVGLSPYAALPLFCRRGATVSWGDESTIEGFLTHVLRREYGTLQLATKGIAAAPNATETAFAFLTDGVLSFGFWVLPFLAASVWEQGQRDAPTVRRVLLIPPVLAVLLIVLLGNLPVSDLLHRGIVARFWMQPMVYVALFIGFGVDSLARLLPRGAAVSLAWGLAVAPFALRYHGQDQHENRLVRTYGTEILRVAPEHALVLTRGDLITNTTRYLQATAAARPDVRIVDLELLGFPWYVAQIKARYPDIVIPGARYMPGDPNGFTIKQLLDANAAALPIVSCGGWKSGDTTSDTTYGRWPLGLCDRVLSGAAPVNVEEWLETAVAAMPHISSEGLNHPPGSWEDIAVGDFNAAAESVPTHLINLAGADITRRGYLVKAASLFEQILRESPHPHPRLYKTYAIALGRSGLDTPESREKALSAWKSYLASNPTDEPNRPMIEAEIVRLEGLLRSEH